MSNDTINYENLVDDALRTVVREALRRISENSPSEIHHLYISFKTRGAGVEISDSLRDQFPEEMTIVLQNQFWNLSVEEDQFCVTLNFNKLPHELVIPLTALTGFADQRATFSLQFGKDSTAPKDKYSATGVLAGSLKTEKPVEQGDKRETRPKVVTLDAFRKT